MSGRVLSFSHIELPLAAVSVIVLNFFHPELPPAAVFGWVLRFSHPEDPTAAAFGGVLILLDEALHLHAGARPDVRVVESVAAVGTSQNWRQNFRLLKNNRIFVAYSILHIFAIHINVCIYDTIPVPVVRFDTVLI